MKLTQTQLKKMILQEIKAVLTEEITSVKKQGGISEKEVKIAEKILDRMSDKDYGNKDNWEQHESDLTDLEDIIPMYPGPTTLKFKNHKELYNRIDKAIDRLEKLNKGQY
jgi:uncharacterized protein (UPF0305 family)